jgi:hypothetical protein
MPFLAIALIVLFVFIGPYFTILAINTLFGLGIEVTFGTWFATLWLMLVIAGRTK